MSQASMSSESDGGNIELGASLLLATTTTTSSSKYNKIWHRSKILLYIKVIISLRKDTTSSDNYEESLPPSPLPNTSLLPSSPARTSSAKSFVGIDIPSHTQEGYIAEIVKKKDLISLLKFGGVDRVCEILHGQTHHPLEKITGNLGTSFSSILWNSCKHNRYTISMMLISASLSFATELKQEGPKYGWHDGVAMVFFVLLLLAFSSITNFWCERKMVKLAKRKGQEVKFNVKRGEHDLVLPVYDIVVGDIVCLSPRDEVPADGLLVSGDVLVLDDGIQNEKIDCRENPFLIAGSKVIEGHGQMVVTSVENKLNVAEMKGSMNCNFEKKGLLYSLIEKPISNLDKASLLIFTLVSFVLFIRLICKKDGDGGGLPDIKGNNVSIGLLAQLLENIFLRPRGNISILAGLFSVVMLCVQHGVPLMVTLSLHYQNDKVLVNQEVVLNDLSGCTTMGLVTVICIDVSGGIISKPMEVSKIWVGEGERDMSKVEESETCLVLDKLKQGLGLSVLAPGLSPSPVSNSLVSWAEKTWKMDILSFREDFHILKHSKLDSDQEGSGVLARNVRVDEQIMHMHWSGDAPTILEMCSQYYDSEGACHSIGNQKLKFRQAIQKMEDNGLKSIAFACRETQVQQLEQDELTLLALVGLEFKCQESTKLALQNLKNNGIEIKLVSEDDIMVVKDMACELRIEVPVNSHLEGKELQDLNAKERLVKVEQAIAMGSFSPKDKHLMVRCLQDKGDVVAFIDQERLMTNHNSEVLKLADVGIVHNSLRRTIDGREKSGITITCFGALVPIIKAGRSKYHSIQKFIQLQMTVGISGLLITLITIIFTGNSPLTAIQLIWVNMLMCILGGLMMVMELSSEDEQKQPSGRNQPIITKKIWKNIVFQVFYQASACMILEFGGHVTDSEKQVRKIMIFNTFFLCQLFNLLNIMGFLKADIFKIDVQKSCFLVALGGCVVMQVVVIEYAKGLADCMRLNAARWAICVLVSAVPWVLEWTLKKIFSVFFSTNYSSPLDSPESTPQPLFYLYWGLPFMMLLLFPFF
ncbi:putative calcium-transporting ATPase 13, plasma membrane-type isoform X1 [Trifolium pratense]|uniref:putative calcium-transporting ATPase 13, plasma membrane-type isoform X1 n=1 Tax=Trifolium pratense TaxID=57577 RepID=UPI001E697E03|nr:putative calcium-transporting ATPase 13, plasma membrane-type isoform X1 [Trifolium pratense]